MSNHTTFPVEVQKAGEQMHAIVDGALHATLSDLVTTHNNRDRTSAVYTAIMAMAGPLTFISRCIAECPEGEETTAEVTGKELTLVAGLIAGRVLQLEKEGIKCDFSGRNILAAVEAASVIAGYDVKPLISKAMIQSYTEGMERDGKTDLGYWDYLPETTPSFDEFADQLRNVTNFSNRRH